MNQIKNLVLLVGTLRRHTLRVLVVLLLLGLLIPVYTYTREYTRVQTAKAATGINRQINFQGKLVNPNGTNVTDGTYSIVFSIYSVASAGTANWTETQSVTVTNGIFQVNLGSVSSLPSSVDFNTDNIYLGIKVGADAEMTPRIRFTSVPQAFNAEKLGGLDKTGFIQNSTSLQSTSNFYIQSNNASNVTAKFRAISSQSADIIQVRDSGDTTTVFAVSPAGTITAGTWNGAALTDAYVSDTLTSSIFIGSGSTTNAIDLGTAEVAGTLGVGNGGTGLASYTAGDLLYASGTTTLGKLASVATGSCLTSQGVGSAPAWATCVGSEADTLASVTARGATTSTNVTFNGTLNATTDTTFSLSGSENIAVSSDLAAGVNLIQIIGTPSATAGTTRGILVQQANSANTNGLDTGILVNNADTDLAIGTALQISNTGGGGYTNYISAPSFTLDGTGTITAGTWNGTALTDAYVSNILTASIFAASGSITDAVDLVTAEVSGTLAILNGGTGATTFTSNGVLYGNASSAIQATAAGTGGQVLLANASGVPTFTSISSDITLSNTGVATIAANSVALTTDTTGNYVANNTAGTGIAVTGSAGEGWSPTISLDYSATLAGNPALTASQSSFASTGLIFEGSNPDTNELLLIAADPGSDVTLTLPNVTGTIIGTGNITDITGLIDSQISNTLTASILIGSGSTSNAVDLATAEVAGTLGGGNGGTGLATYTVGDLLYASGTSTLSKLAAVASGSCLISQGTGTAPAWGSCTTGAITGTGTNGQVTYFNGTGTVTSSANLLFNGTTLTPNALTVTNAATFNGTLTANANVNFTFNGTENLALSSDLDGGVNVLQIVGTPSATAGTTRGILVQQADSANTNGLDSGILINNADTDMAITNALQISNSGGGGYTNYISAPSFTLDGTGTITAGTWNGTALTDAFVSNTLTASILIGSGSTTNAVDLATAEVAGTLGVANGGTGATSLTDLIALGSNTTGNYVASNTAGTGIAITGSAGEGWSPTISLDYSSSLGSNPTLTANQTTFAANGLIFEGSSADTIETLLYAANPSGADVLLQLPNVTGNIIGTGNLNEIIGLTDSQISDTLTASDFLGSGSTTTAVDLGTAEVAGTLTVGKGGTGLASYTIGDLLYASGTTTLAKLASIASGSCLTSQGVGTAPAWGSCGLSAEADTLATVTGRGATTSTNTSFNGTLTATSDVTFTLAGIENFTLTSDLAGSVNIVQITATPSATAGTTRGLFVRQANSANTNGLDTALFIDNADTDLAVGRAIHITDSGGGFTQLIDTPTFDVSGTGAVTGVTTLAASTSVTTPTLQNNSADLAIQTNTSGNITITPAASAGLVNVLTGNLKVGNGTPTVTLNGEDAYIEGTLEVDGAANFDGGLTVTGALNVQKSSSAAVTDGSTTNTIAVTGSFMNITETTGTSTTTALSCITGGTDGRMLVISNITGETLTLNHNDNATCGAASNNNILIGKGTGSITIRQNGSTLLMYDATADAANDGAWRAIDSDCSDCADRNLDNLLTTSINQDLLSSGTGTKDIGSAANRWNWIYGNRLDISGSASSNPIATFTNSYNAVGGNPDILWLDYSSLNCNSNTSPYLSNVNDFVALHENGGSYLGGISAVQSASNCSAGTHVAYKTNGADYAEYFLSDPNNKPTAYELVSFKSKSLDKVTERATDTRLPIIGAVSTTAGFVGNGPVCTSATENGGCIGDYESTNSLVSLVGQVKVKVDNSNGVIQVGDPIGLSTTPGTGSKLLGSGYIVGYAIEALNDTSGEITVLIRPSFYTSPLGDLLQGSSLSVSGDATISGSLSVGDELNVSGATTLTSLTVTGDVTVQGNLTVMGSIETRTITVNGHIITAGDVPMVTVGDAAGQVTAGNPEPAVAIDGNDAAGTVSITTGSQNTAAGVLAHITFAEAFSSGYKVVLSASNDKAGTIRTHTIKTATGFDIVANDVISTQTQYDFDYIVLGTAAQ